MNIVLLSILLYVRAVSGYAECCNLEESISLSFNRQFVGSWPLSEQRRLAQAVKNLTCTCSNLYLGTSYPD